MKKNENKSGRKVALAIRKIAEVQANIAFGSASICGLHQMKEPKCKKMEGNFL